jgi:hypothetical protein
LERPVAIAQQHVHYTIVTISFIYAPIGHNQIKMPVRIKVPNRNFTVGISTGEVADRWLERAVAIAQQHTYFPWVVSATGRIHAIVGYHQIRVPISIHVGHRYGIGIAPAGAVTDRSLESAVSVAEQHAYRAGAKQIVTGRAALAVVGNHQIQLAVAVHIRNCNRRRHYTSRTVADGSLEPTLAIADQHAHSTLGAVALAETEVRNHHVKDTVPI